MDINDKMLADLASELGLPQNNRSNMEKAKRKASGYQNKSDDEVLKEILNLKDTLKKDRAAYEKQMATLRALRGVMQGEQRQRLERIISMLEN